MIYLNLNFKNAGLIFDNEVHYSDIKIEEKIDIEIIKDIFKKYRILKGRFGSSVTEKNLKDFKNERTKSLVFKKTIINIYKNRDGYNR